MLLFEDPLKYRVGEDLLPVESVLFFVGQTTEDELLWSLGYAFAELDFGLPLFVYQVKNVPHIPGGLTFQKLIIYEPYRPDIALSCILPS